MYIYPASLLCDFYKVSHKPQYPADTEVIYATWTPRGTLIPELTEVVAFGFQAFVKKYLLEYFKANFFDRSEKEVVAEYQRVLRVSLGIAEPDAEHIRDLHRLGYLPLLIKALPEGTVVPLRVPMLTIENTNHRFFWLTNFVESLMSAELWQPATAATIARDYRRILDEAAMKTVGSTNFVQFQGHDFSFRGMEGLDASKGSGMGHLLSFVGTDTIPAILATEEFYGADIEKELIGTSIPATEHSVMEALGMDEVGAFHHLLTKVYPSGFFSVVSDTWDLWKVITEVLPQLKVEIMSRNGRMVIRPDSGDPVKILCGDVQSPDPRARKGVVELLWDTFGGTVSEQGYKILDSHIGVIYGDAITRHRAKEICAQLAEKGFASINVVYGIGSYTYQFNTRDTFGFALKTTFGQFGGEKRLLFKKPITDNGTKISQKGRVSVKEVDGVLAYTDGYFEDQPDSLLRPIFENGEIRNETTFAEIRDRLRK